MEWLAENWLWVFIGVVFVGMHLFGHGCHGGHGGNNSIDKSRTGTPSSDKHSDHQH